MAEYSANPLAAYSTDSGSSVFEPDVMLPSQFLVPDEQGLSGGERKLMAALLTDGIEAFIHQSVSQLVRKSKVKSDACEWIEAQDDSYVFSFDNVCECLGINPEYLRIGLYRYVETVRQARESAPDNRSAWKKIRRPRKQ